MSVSIKNFIGAAFAVAILLGSASLFLLSINKAFASEAQDDKLEQVTKTGYLYYASSDGAELQDWVLKKQGEGWVCEGGMAPVYQQESKKWIYFQTMVKK